MTASADIRALLRNAVLLERAGRLAEAEAAYVQLLSRWPNLPDSWYNLALLQRRAGRFDAALASYQQALDRGVSQPEEVHLNRGVIYSDYLRQDAAAERELQAALALNPNYIPALLNLANLREDFGKREEARTIYERILAIEPRCREALARYANLLTPSGPDDPLIGRLQDGDRRRWSAPRQTGRASVSRWARRLTPAAPTIRRSTLMSRRMTPVARAPVRTPRFTTAGGMSSLSMS